MAEIKRTYYETGELLSEVFVIDGKINGEYKSYHDNGQLEMECTFIDDNKNGECKEYNENGELIEYSIWKDGEKIEVKTT